MGKMKSTLIHYQNIESSSNLLSENIQSLEKILQSGYDVHHEITRLGLGTLYRGICDTEAFGVDIIGDLRKTKADIQHIGKISKKMHEEIIQNIDSTATRAVSDAMELLNNVNEGKNEYKAKNMTKTEVTTQYGDYGESYDITTKRPLTLDEVMAGNDSDLKFVKDYFDKKIQDLREAIAASDMPQSEKDNLANMTADELKYAIYSGKIGNFESLRGTWYDENREVFKWLDIGVKIGGGILAAVLAPVTGGASLVIYGGILLGKLAAEAFLNNGRNLITGEKMKTGDYILGALEAALSIIPGLGMLDDVAHVTQLVKITNKVSATLGKVVTQIVKIGKPLFGTMKKIADFFKKYRIAIDLGGGALAGAVNGEGIESVLLGAAIAGALGVLFDKFGEDIITTLMKKIKAGEVNLKNILKGIDVDPKLTKEQIKKIARDFEVKVGKDGVITLVGKEGIKISDKLTSAAKRISGDVNTAIDASLPKYTISDKITEKVLGKVKNKLGEDIKNGIETPKSGYPNLAKNVADMQGVNAIINDGLDEKSKEKVLGALKNLTNLNIDELNIERGLLQAL